jgi:hypothetical protein
VALLGKKEQDDYYRNDSMKYCRHNEEKKKEVQNEGRERRLK